MELRHIRYFVALAERLNFTHAAAQVHVTQSTLSHQIRQLEEELGQPLFLRSQRHVLLTAAGELFLPKALQALGELDAGIALMSIAGMSELAGEVRIGTTPTFNIHVVPRVISDFYLRHPAVRVSVEEDTSANIASKVLTRKLDLAIAYHPGREAKLAFEPLCNEEMVLVTGTGHPLAARRRVRVVELHRRELILPPVRFATRRLLDEAFASSGASPVVRVESDSITAMLSAVRQSQLATIVSLHAVQADPRLKIIPLENPTPVRTPGLMRLRKAAPSPIEASFAAIVREVTNLADFQRLPRR